MKLTDNMNDFIQYEIFITNLQQGMILVEANETAVVDKAISLVRSHRNPLIIDFIKNDVFDYNIEVKKSYYDCVIFYNLTLLEKPERLIENFNLNRDNFREQHLLYIFIMPKFLSDYLHIRTPNLRSYFTTYLNLCVNYKTPFKPFLSLDKYVIDKTQEHDLHIVERKLHTDNKFTPMSYDEVLDELSYYEFHKCNEEKMKELLKTGLNYLFNCRSPYNILNSFIIRCASVMFKQKMYRLVLDICKLLLSFILFDYKEEHNPFKSPEKYIGQNEQKFFILIYEYMELNQNTIDIAQIVLLLRLYASSLFYTRKYKIALQGFMTANSILDNNSTTFTIYSELRDSYYANLNDILLCKYKLQPEEFLFDFEKQYMQFLQPCDKDSLTITVQFILDFNYALYVILGARVIHYDYHLFEKQARLYEELCNEKSSIFLSYLSLLSWIYGCVEGKLDDALDLSKRALKLKRVVFTENHRSIAESHYCNGIYYYMKQDYEKAHICFKKAHNILKKPVKGSRSLVQEIDQFLEDIAIKLKIN